MTLETDIEQWFSEKPLSENTTDKYRRALENLQKEHPNLETLTSLELKSYLNKETWGDSQRWVNYSAIRSFLRWRYGSTHPALLLKIKRIDSGPQRSLKQSQVLDLLAHFDTHTPKGLRDLAICALALDSGLRCSELCHLELKHLDLDSQTLSVKIKGGRWEKAGYSEHTTAHLHNWLHIRDSEAKTVFVSLGGLTPGQPLTREGLQIIVRHWGENIGIELSPHDLRRTFAVLSTAAGAPARLLQIAGRWRSLEMVERYTRTIDPAAFRPYFPLNTIMAHDQQP